MSDHVKDDERIALLKTSGFDNDDVHILPSHIKTQSCFSSSYIRLRLRYEEVIAHGDLDAYLSMLHDILLMYPEPDEPDILTEFARRVDVAMAYHRDKTP